jgi:acetyl esterase/lipase
MPTPPRSRSSHGAQFVAFPPAVAGRSADRVDAVNRGRPGIRCRRRLLTLLIVLVVGLGTPVLVYRTSVQPGAALVKAVFTYGTNVTPPSDYTVIANQVTETPRLPIEVRDAPPASVDVYAPTVRPREAMPMVLWVHGGGFISGTSENVHDFAVLLAQQGFVVASLDYALAPAAHHPVPVRQGAAALRDLVASAARFGGDPSSVFVGGDSAGAQIAGELAAVQTNRALAGAIGLGPAVPVRGAILYCGLYDMRTVGGTGFPALRTYLWSYTGVRDWTSFRDIDQLSVTAQVTPAYPPTFLTVGDTDPFRSQAVGLAAALRAQRVPVAGQIHTEPAGLGHEYQFDFGKPAAVANFGATVAFLRRYGGPR